MARRDESRHDFAFLAGVIIGAIAGAAATLALAPGSGSETREKLRGRVQDLDVESIRERAKNTGEMVKERAKEASSQMPAASDLAATAKSKANAAVERSPIGGNNGSSMADEAKGTVDDLTHRSTSEKAQDKLDDATTKAANVAEQKADQANQAVDEASKSAQDAADQAQQTVDEQAEKAKRETKKSTD